MRDDHDECRRFGLDGVGGGGGPFNCSTKKNVRSVHVQQHRADLVGVGIES